MNEIEEIEIVEKQRTSLGVKLVCGGIAGVIGTLIIYP
jgi:hypothetical protein